jgi:hypothetical protein
MAKNAGFFNATLRKVANDGHKDAVGPVEVPDTAVNIGFL